MASAVTIADGNPVRGMRRQALENRSTTTRIRVKASEAVMKSTPKCEQGSREKWAVVGAFLQEDAVVQPWTKRLTS